MSHQSGISVSPQVVSKFKELSSNDSQRLMRIVINEETLTVASVEQKKSTWQDDFSVATRLLQNDTPSYIVYKKDDGNFILLCHVPDNAKVRDKMLYASTKATLMKELGDSLFVDSVYGTSVQDFSAEGYRKHQTHQQSSAPLTTRELELQQVKLSETGADIGASSKKSHVSGISFPLSKKSDDALAAFQGQSQSFIIFHIDNETIEVLKSSYANSLTAIHDELIKLKHPCYSLFQYQNINGFVYYCPGVSSVKLKMVYSSCKGALMSHIASAGIEVQRKIEIVDEKDLSEDNLMIELGLKTVDNGRQNPSPSQNGFIKKVVGPAGGRRLIRTTE
ncbi:hypothetical protein MP228_008951 [Amoeboaphelidium protococcarum]|nr:hypothetical protein MP228_008951 [Amoeboaphelidium protococcarum]